jgi:hypothetical protein
MTLGKTTTVKLYVDNSGNVGSEALADVVLVDAIAYPIYIGLERTTGTTTYGA